MIPTPEQLAAAPNPEFERRVVVKFRDNVRVPFGDAGPHVASVDPPVAPGDPAPAGGNDLASAEGTEAGPSASWATDLLQGQANARVERLFSTAPEALRSLRSRAREAGAEGNLPNLENFFSVKVPANADPAALLAAARAMAGVEFSYVPHGPSAPPTIDPSNDLHTATQGYLGPAPAGIDARYAWTRPGGDGAGVQFIDLERGWTLTHEDLTGATITLISGLSRDYHGHGTAVLGEVVGQDNDKGVVGIVPNATAKVVSQWRTATTYDTADAILSAYMVAPAGSVLLLEAQTSFGSQSDLPVEVEDAVWSVIRVVTLLGLVVVEAAGNGGHDLDAFNHPTHGRMLQRGHADFRDSGAIMVGAASSAAPHTRMSFSCYGSRIDCFGWGQNVTTTGDGWTGNLTNTYTTSFSGTSSASPIVAGAAVAAQGMHKARHPTPMSPAALRTLLTTPTLTTASATPATDKIGVMPDLRKIADHLVPRTPAAPTSPVTLHADTERVAMAFLQRVFGSLNLSTVPTAFFVGLYAGWGSAPITALGQQVRPRFGLRLLRHTASSLSAAPAAWRGSPSAWPTFPLDQFLTHPLYLRRDQATGSTATVSTPTTSTAPHEILLAAERWYAIVRYTVAETTSTQIRLVDVLLELHPGTGDALTWTALANVAGGVVTSHFVQAAVFRSVDGLNDGERTGTAAMQLEPMAPATATP